MKKIIVAAVVIALLVAGGFYYWAVWEEREPVLSEEEKKQLEEILNATSTASAEEIKPIIKEINYLPYQGQNIAEAGNSPIMSQFPADKVKQYKDELARLKSVLEKDPTDVEAWMKVGLLKKVFGNYVGARDAWEYAVNEFASNDATVLANLADLFGFYLGDKEKAEAYFERSIEADKNQTNVYINAADFYRNVYTEKEGEAEKTILQGLNNLPNDESLLIYLASYYRDKGDKKQAIEYYEKVLVVDPGNEAVKEEVVRLKK